MTLGRSANSIRNAAWIGIGCTGVLLAGVILFSQVRLARQAGQQATTDPAATLRTQYADLYAAATRDDQGRGSVVMSATLFTPSLVNLLGRDADRSETEEQMWRLVRDLDSKTLPIFLTIDSVAGPLSDATIAGSLSLMITGQERTAASWRPIILTNKSVDSSLPVSSQAGFAFFNGNEAINWPGLTSLSLTSRNIADQPLRTFVWADVSPLLATPE